jgi:hypothetical protein
MTEEEAKGVCKDRSKWKEVIFAPKGNGHVVMYICMYSFNTTHERYAYILKFGNSARAVLPLVFFVS